MPIPNMPLLSFVHDLYSIQQVQTDFKSDPEAVMDRYGLTWEQKIAIYHSGADPVYVTKEAVPNFPIVVNPTKITAPNPNPVTADWWAAYSQYMAARIAGTAPPLAPVPNPRTNDRPVGDRVSMAGVMVLLAEELGLKANWTPVW